MFKQLRSVNTFNFLIFKQFYKTKASNSKEAKCEINSKNLQKFFQQDSNLRKIIKLVPEKYLYVSRQKSVETLYLLSPSTAKTIANIIRPFLDSGEKQIISETNGGLGLISAELLEHGIKLIRFYESCSEFRKILKKLAVTYPNRVEIYRKDIFHLHRYAYLDKLDNSNRVEALLKEVPKRAWTDDPVLTVIGTITNLNFFRYLVKMLALQTGPISYGRIQVFAIMRPKDYAIFCSTTSDNQNAYQSWTIIFNLIFDHTLLQKFPRNEFLPWESHKHLKSVYPRNLEMDKMYLVKINFKKELPVPIEQLLPLIFFIRQLYIRGSNKVIPTLEEWLPNSGLNVLLPTLNHDDYPTDINIFTKFRELTPEQILAVYKEVFNSSEYSGSPFMTMVENELLHYETIETSLADANLEKNIIEDIEEKC